MAGKIGWSETRHHHRDEGGHGRRFSPPWSPLLGRANNFSPEINCMRAHGFHVGFSLPWVFAISLLLYGCGGSDVGSESFRETGQASRQQESASTTEEASTEGRVLLTVTDSAGNPASGAVVKLSGAMVGEEETDTEGNTLFTSLPIGSYTLQASKGNTSHPKIHFEVTSGESLERKAVLRPMKEFSIFGAIRDVTDYRFSDSIPGPTIAVEKGDLVRIVFSVPEKDIAHALAINEFAVSSPTVGAGESTIIEFVADRTGEFHYYCPLPSHRTLGMEGKFVVN